MSVCVCVRLFELLLSFLLAFGLKVHIFYVLLYVVLLC